MQYNYRNVQHVKLFSLGKKTILAGRFWNFQILTIHLSLWKEFILVKNNV